jgi:hypothetical protein
MNHFVQFHLTSQQQKINRFFSVKKIQGLEGSLPNWISATVKSCNTALQHDNYFKNPSDAVEYGSEIPSL